MQGISSKPFPFFEIPDNEIDRLAALEKYRILDSEEDQDFDDLVLLASQICDTPIAFITLIDSKRQWFKAKTGWNHIETARHLSFCTHTILQDEIMVVPDATKDQRFCGNPLVTHDPHIRF